MGKISYLSILIEDYYNSLISLDCLCPYCLNPELRYIIFRITTVLPSVSYLTKSFVDEEPKILTVRNSFVSVGTLSLSLQSPVLRDVYITTPVPVPGLGQKDQTRRTETENRK